MPARYIRVRPGGSLLSTGGATPKLISSTPEVDNAPLAVDDTGNAVAGGGNVLFDVLVNDSGLSPLSLQSVVIVSGGGAVAIDTGKIRFTPPGTAGVTEIDYVVKNIVGTDTGRLTVTTTLAGNAPNAIDNVVTVSAGNEPFDVAVLTNDTGTPPLTLDSIDIVSGNAGASIVGSSIRVTPPSSADVTEIDYAVSNAFGSDTGRLTVTTLGASEPPVVGLSGGFGSTANLSSFTFASGLTTPANTRAMIAFVYAYLDFSAGDPEAITAQSLSYGGTPMVRVDGYGNSFKRASGPAIFAFLLQTPGDAIPAGGNLAWSITIANGGQPQVVGCAYHFITDPNDDVLFSILHQSYPATTGTSIDSPFTAADAALVINASAINGNGAWTGDSDAAWNEIERRELIGSSAAVSGAMVVEAKTFSSGAADTHTLSSNAADYRSTITVQFQGQGSAAPNAPVAVDDAGDAVTGGADVLFDVLANDTGDPPLVVDSLAIFSGGGSAVISGNQIRFTPPGTAGVTEIDYTVVNGSGSDVGRLTITTADPVAPTANDDTAESVASGIPILIDVLANDAGSAPLTLVSVTPISAAGSAVVVDNQVEYTSADGSGTDTFTCTVSNAAGSDTSTLTVNYSDITLGPRQGFGVGIGQTETSAAAINAAVQAARASFETELTGLHDRGLTDAEIIAANPGFVTLTGKGLSDLNNALSAGNRRLFLTATGGAYDWSSATWPDFNDIELVGLADAGMPEVIVGGTVKNRGQVRCSIRGQGGRVEGIEFRDGAVVFSFVGASGIIPRMHVRNNKFTRVGNSVHMEFGGSNPDVTPGAGCSSIIFNNNICEDVGHGFNMRCGPGYGEGPTPTSPDFAVGAFEAKENIVKTFANMGIACHLDTRGGTSGNVFWPVPGSLATIERNVIDDSDLTISGFGGFPMNATACEDFVYRGNFVTRSNNPSGFDFDVYTKSNSGVIEDNVIWDTGLSSNFQGMLGMKGEGNSGQLPLGTVTVRNNLIGHSTSFGNGRVIFIQRNGVELIQNVLVTVGDNGILTQQSAGDYHLESLENLYRTFGGYFESAAVQISAGSVNWLFERDTFDDWKAGSHTIVQARNSSGRANSSPTLLDCIFKKNVGAGTATAFRVQQSGSTLSNPSMTGCQLEDIDVAINLTGTITGVAFFQGNQHTGITPTTSNGAGATVQTFGAAGGNSFT